MVELRIFARYLVCCLYLEEDNCLREAIKLKKTKKSVASLDGKVRLGYGDYDRNLSFIPLFYFLLCNHLMVEHV